METNNIKTEKEYRSICAAMDILIEKGTKLGNMELLTNDEKNDYMRLSSIVRQWEKVHYPYPIPINPLIAQIQERMAERNLKQRDTARLLGIDEALMSEILRGKKPIGMRLAKNLRKCLQIDANIILEFA